MFCLGDWPPVVSLYPCVSLCHQDGSAGSPSEVKVWSPDRLDTQGRPLCLRSLAPDPRPAQGSQRQSQASQHGLGRGQVPRVTALAVHPNLSLMAVGCSDGSIILYRGRSLMRKIVIMKIRTSEPQLTLDPHLQVCICVLYYLHVYFCITYARCVLHCIVR